MITESNQNSEYSNEDAKSFYLELIKDENWKDGFVMANEPFRGANGANCSYKTPYFANVTDGVKDLADKNLCHWFIDLILSINTTNMIPREFQEWVLLVKDGTNYIIGEDGNNNVLISHILPSTDFTNYGSTAVRFWLIDDLVLLPEEY